MLEFNAENHEYKIDGIRAPSVTQIIPAPEHLQFIRNLEEKRLQGTERHEKIKMFFDLGGYEEPQEWDDTELQTFSDLIHDNKFLLGDLIVYEKPMYSVKYHFCGTPDAVFENALVDFKSSMVNKTHSALQFAGYSIMIEELGILKTKNWLVIFRNRDKWKIQKVYHPRAKKMFLELRKKYEIEQNYKKYMEGK